MEILYTASLIVIAMVIARLFSSFVAYYKYLGAKGTVLFSLGDSMPLTFLIAIATIAISNNAISLNEYYAFVLAAIIEAIVIMVIIKVILKKVK